MGESPLVIWAVSDGRAGIEAQAAGLADAVARLRPARVEVRRIAWKPPFGRLPWRLIAPVMLDPASGVAPPWPDIWIATGRATLPLSTRMRRWSEGRTFVVQTQHPRAPLKSFDLVIPPRHDGLAGRNVFPITGSPHRLTAERLAEARTAFSARIDPLPEPRVAVLVGGRSKAHRLPPALAADMGRQIAEAVRLARGSVLATFSRRTPAPARQAMTEALAQVPGWIWDETGENPYFAFLAAADAILVTEDSTNMATEAAFTGKPVHLLYMQGRSDKHARFQADLAERGVLRRFKGRIEHWVYPPLDETTTAAKELLRRYDARLPSAGD